MDHNEFKNIVWFTWFWTRCKAKKEPGMPGSHWGRCERRKGHKGDHALERGMEIPMWSTDWTRYEMPSYDQ